MTIADLLGRIGLAFERTFYLVMLGEFGDLVLSDLGIIALIVVVSFSIIIIFGAVAVAVGAAAWSSDWVRWPQLVEEEPPQPSWGHKCDQCGCLFDRDPDGDNECPDCGSDETSVHVFGDK